MKNKMIKLSVIAAVLSGVSFVAGAAENAQLDLTAVVAKASCDVKVNNGTNFSKTWTTMASDFGTTPGALGQPVTLTVEYGSCVGENLADAGTIDLVANAGAQGSTLSAKDLWGDSDDVGVGFSLTATPDGGAETPLTPTANSLTVFTAPADDTDPTDIEVNPTTLSIDLASYLASSAIVPGTVKSVITLSALYQ